MSIFSIAKNMKITVQYASLKHLDTLYRIEAACFREEAFTRNQIAALLRDPNSLGYVAKCGNRVIGFVLGTIYRDQESLQGHIMTIDVLPTYRRKGIGRILMQQTEELFRQKGVRASVLEVREDNAAAVGMYKKLGYEKKRKLRNYYGVAHGILLEKLLM